jgi:hypothetical protein
VTDSATLIAQARAYVERVLMSLDGRLPRMPDARAVAELEDVLSVLDQAGYVVEARSARRGTFREIQAELSAAVEGLRGVARDGHVRGVGAAGGHVETALQHLRWRLNAPASPVIDRVVAVASAAAAPARPLSEAVDRLGDDLPSGAVDEGAEVRRAIELAFVAAVRWLPAVSAAAGDPDAGLVLRSLEHSQASYLADFLREETLFPDVAHEAVENAVAALDAAGRLGHSSSVVETVDVADDAAQVLRAMIDLRSPAVVDELRSFIDHAGAWPLRLPTRELS